MVVSGSGLIWVSNIKFFQTPFLIAGVALYLVAFTIALGILVPTTTKLLRLAELAPAPAPGDEPPPVVMAMVRRLQMFGGVTTVLFLVIIFLMIIQPGGLAFR
jgi:hypothetical protein